MFRVIPGFPVFIAAPFVTVGAVSPTTSFAALGGIFPFSMSAPHFSTVGRLLGVIFTIYIYVPILMEFCWLMGSDTCPMGLLLGGG